MPSTPPKRPPNPWFRALLILGMLLILTVAGLMLSFLPGAETRCLSQAALDAMPRAWERRLGVGLGRAPMWIARTALHGVRLEPEVRTILEAFRRGDVYVFTPRAEAPRIDPTEVVTSLRSAMARRHWEPAVIVAERESVVALFTPASPDDSLSLHTVAAILAPGHLIVAGAEVDGRILGKWVEGQWK